MNWCEDRLFDIIQDLHAAERTQDRLCFKEPPSSSDIEKFVGEVNNASRDLSKFAAELSHYVGEST